MGARLLGNRCCIVTTIAANQTGSSEALLYRKFWSCSSVMKLNVTKMAKKFEKYGLSYIPVTEN
jgi:hypothetical protein